MKKIDIYRELLNTAMSLSLTAAAGFAAVSCSEITGPESGNAGKAIEVTVEASVNNGGDSQAVTETGTAANCQTKTIMTDEVQGTISWNAEGETLKVIECYDSASGDHQAVNTDGFSTDGDKAIFSLSITPAEGKEHYYYTAIYPASAYNPASNSTAGSFRLTLPAKQTAGTDSFDPEADLMRSNAISADLAETPKLSFSFTRIVSVNKMLLKGLTPGEKISEVVIESSKALAGNCLTNLTGTYVKTSTAAEKTLTVIMSDAAVSAEGELAVWFTSYPATFGDGDSMDITVSGTDGCVYKRSIAFSEDKTLEFKSGSGTKFSVGGWTKTLPLLNFTTAENIESYNIPASAGQTSEDNEITVGGHSFTIAGRKIDDANQITYYAYYNTSAKLYSLYFTRKGSVSSDYQYGIIELPKVAGYAPASLDITAYNSAAKTYRVCDVARTVPTEENVAGTLIIPAKSGDAATMELNGASSDKSYYLWIPLWVQFRQLSVTYTQQ